jgi:hypothetical protein
MPDYSVRDVLCDMGGEAAVLFENPNYDAAIIGVTEDGRAVYDYCLMLRVLAVEDGMTEEDAADFVSYNTIRAIPYAGPMAPIVMTALPENPELEKLIPRMCENARL